MKLITIFVRSNGLRVWQLIIYLTFKIIKMKIENQKKWDGSNYVNLQEGRFELKLSLRSMSEIFNSNLNSSLGSARFFNFLLSQIENKPDEYRQMWSGHQTSYSFKSIALGNGHKYTQTWKKGEWPPFIPNENGLSNFEKWKNLEPILHLNDDVFELKMSGLGRSEHDINPPQTIDYFYETVETFLIVFEKNDNIYIVEAYQNITCRDKMVNVVLI